MKATVTKLTIQAIMALIVGLLAFGAGPAQGNNDITIDFDTGVSVGGLPGAPVTYTEDGLTVRSIATDDGTGAPDTCAATPNTNGFFSHVHIGDRLGDSSNDHGTMTSFAPPRLNLAWIMVGSSPW